MNKLDNFKKKALDYHSQFTSGKRKISPTKGYKTKEYSRTLQRNIT